MQRPKALVLHSGGLDSTVLLYEMLCDFDIRWTVGVNYGQRHDRELLSAHRIARGLGLSRFETTVNLNLKSSSQTNEDVQVPEGHYTAENMAVTVVPNRNMILLAIAAAKAQDLSVDVVGFGAHAGDHAIYPDCRVEFIEKLDLAINYATEGKVQIFAPFTGVTKADIVKRGVELGVPFELTWTCYKGGDLACGRCGTCVERLEAFEIAGAVDPLEYEDREFWQSVVRVH